MNEYFNDMDFESVDISGEPEEWPGTCICDEDLPPGTSPDHGHLNDTGGYCCPHHGNTCGYCHQYR